MKNLLALLVIACISLIACSKEKTNSDFFSKNGINSKKEFMGLCHSNVYPLNKLGAASQEIIANSLIFENHELIGIQTNVGKDVLTFDDYYLYLQILFGANPIFIIDDQVSLPYDKSFYLRKASNIHYNPSLPSKYFAPEKCPAGAPYCCHTCGGECAKGNYDCP